jgi:16S rRNA (cytosine1402-N4)-methyltransferase
VADSQHIPVLADQVLHWLAPQAGQVVVDGTLGGGGHARLLADRVGSEGLVVGLDRDPAAVEAAERSLAGLPMTLAVADFCDLPEILVSLGIAQVDRVLLDLGVSSDQLADSGRGFSFCSEGPLDLRFNPNRGEPAWRLLQRLSAEHLAGLLFEFGEERYSRRIARQIVGTRHRVPIRTASQLAQLVRDCIPARGAGRIDPATRTFQALRIAVNGELKSLETGLRRIPECLRPDGRLAVISFHSLEDRRVKLAFREDPRYEMITRKPIRPDADQRCENPRCRSARLRVAARATA